MGVSRILQLCLQALRALNPLRRIRDRWWLSRAKHPSLAGHPYTALTLSRWLPGYSYDDAQFFVADGAPPEIAALRRRGLAALRDRVVAASPRTLAASEDLRSGISDADFVNAYRVPFQFRDVVARALPVPTVVARAEGARVWDLDGNVSYDLGGSYGVNVLGVEWYKANIAQAVAAANDVGLVLGAYHPVVADNVARLREVSGMDEVSFHMSGTEAVMQAVRLARYHTGRSHVVRFCGAYHGWWDGVQAGPGNPRPAREVYTLAEMSERTLRVLRTRTDIACVLVNPIQAMNPNGSPPSDSTLVSNDRAFTYDRAAYTRWLQQLREVCTARGMALIFDEVFLGFRLARGGVQAYFGVSADLVTYGKTLGGGFPVGVVCGKRAWMRRYRPDAPADICFARGTFNAHPYVMTAMNAFLRHIDTPEMVRQYAGLDTTWERRAAALNLCLEAAGVPVRVGAFTAIWTTLYTEPGRYHWMFQYYLRAQGIMPAWIGTGRFIFSHATTAAEFDDILGRFVAAARAMKADGWWWRDAGTTSSTIRKQVSRELLRVRFGHPAVPELPAPRVPDQPGIAARVTLR